MNKILAILATLSLSVFAFAQCPKTQNCPQKQADCPKATANCPKQAKQCPQKQADCPKACPKSQ